MHATALRLLLLSAVLLPASPIRPLAATPAPLPPAEFLPMPDNARWGQPYLLAQAMSPSLNLTPEQLAMAAKRRRLSLPAKLECSALDTRLPRLERSAHRAAPERKAEAEQALVLARQRFEVLGC